MAMMQSALLAGLSAPTGPVELDTQAIRVVVRLRPLSERERDKEREGLESSNEVLVDTTGTAIQMLGRQFNFDSVMTERTSQQTVFDQTGRRVVDACIAGYHGAILAYGQTGM